MHWWRLTTYGDINHYRWQVKQCNVDECTRHASKKGMCDKHYQRLRKSGHTEDPVRLVDPKRYLQRKLTNHPLAGKNGRVYVHRATLHDSCASENQPLPCYWCAQTVYWSHSDIKKRLVVDHLDHDRHNNTPENLVPACNSCNVKRTRRTNIRLSSQYEAAK